MIQAQRYAMIKHLKNNFFHLLTLALSDFRKVANDCFYHD